MKIESHDQDIKTLLSSAYYKIPRFQRPYSWDRENVQEFWEDIVQDNLGDYFIGSMVVYRDGKQYWGIVDGQQRLSTITILLCVLRDTFSEHKLTDLAEGVHSLVERKNIDNKPEFILSSESSYPYFHDYIQKWGSPELSVSPLKEEQNLERAYEQLKKLVQGVIDGIMIDPSISEERKNEKIANRLKEIRDAILDLKLILVQLDNEDDAYLIFETLNTRGKDLRITDLVKNHLTRLLKNESASVDQTKIKWEEILKTIEASQADINTDTFIHHFWLSRYEYLPAKSIFKTLKKRVGLDEARRFLDDLVADSKIYRGIHEPSYGKWNKQERRIENALKALMLFKVKQQTPAVLALVRAYSKKLIRKAQLEKALVAIEKFHFSFTAITSQRSSGGISAMYASFARRLSKVSNRDEAVALIEEQINKLRERVPSLEEFKALFPEIIYTDNVTKQKNLVRYILEGFHQNAIQSVAVDYSQMTIEHLLSQSQIEDEIDDAIIGQLGNMILISEALNKKLKNKDFSEKKKILLKEKVHLLDIVIESGLWEETQIRKLTNVMAKEAYLKIWKI